MHITSREREREALSNSLLVRGEQLLRVKGLGGHSISNTMMGIDMSCVGLQCLSLQKCHIVMHSHTLQMSKVDIMTVSLTTSVH